MIAATVYKLAIFDFDGTLADTFPVFADSLNQLAVRHHFALVSHDELDQLRSLSAQQILQRLQLPLWRMPSVLVDLRDRMQQRIDEIKLFDGIRDALHTIADQGIMLALATSNSCFNVQAVLGRELLTRFTVVECGATLFGKAHRLRRILEVSQVQVDKAAAIYIGDEIRDVQAARKVGVRFGAVAWGYTKFCAMLAAQPEVSFKVPRDLLSLTRAC